MVNGLEIIYFDTWAWSWS